MRKLIHFVLGLFVAAAASRSPAPPPPTASREHVFAQVAVGGEAATAFLLDNPDSKPISVTIQLYSSEGEPRDSTRVELLPRGRRRVEFSDATIKAWAGWARLTADGPFLATERINNGKSPWVDFPPGQPKRAFYVVGSVRLPDLQTGVALANPNGTEASRVTVVLRATDGSEVRRTWFDLAPGGHRSG